MNQLSDGDLDRPWYQQYQTSFVPHWSQLPATGFVRLWQIIGDPTADPPIPPIIPVKKSCWWAGVKSGRFPQPVKLGPRVTAWRVEDIRALIAKLSLQGAPVVVGTVAVPTGTEVTTTTITNKALPQPPHLPKAPLPSLSSEPDSLLSLALRTSSNGGRSDD